MGAVTASLFAAVCQEISLSLCSPNADICSDAMPSPAVADRIGTPRQKPTRDAKWLSKVGSSCRGGCMSFLTWSVNDLRFRKYETTPRKGEHLKHKRCSPCHLLESFRISPASSSFKMISDHGVCPCSNRV
uniref:Putative secreted protein n=1 Tax=Ixodes ricinus TaxID=34613 RepID=A0A6B0UR81_IXORI